MDSQAFIEMCIEDVDKRIASLPDLGDFEAYCWEQVWPNSSKGFSTMGKDVLTTSMSCAIVFKEISFVYHDDFAYSCKTNKALREKIEKRNLPGLIDTASEGITLLQYRTYPFKDLKPASRLTDDKSKTGTQLSIIEKKKVEKSNSIEKAKGIISVSVRVTNHEKAKELYEKELDENETLSKSGLTYEQWISHQKWLAIRNRLNNM